VPYRISKRTGGAQVFLQVQNQGLNGKSIFRTSEDYKKFVAIVARLSRKTPNLGVIGYVLMRDSYYLVLEELKRGTAPSFLHRLNVTYALYFQYKYQTTGKLFKGPYKDRILNSEDELMVALSKIYRMPEKIGQHNDTYEWSSLKKYLQNKAPWLHKKPIIDYFRTNDLPLALRDFVVSVNI
jgi:putative transposase